MSVDSRRESTSNREGARPIYGSSLNTVVAASFLALAFSVTPVFGSVQSIFLRPVVQEFGWSHATYFLPYTIGGLLAALASPFVGALADRYGARRLMLTGACSFAILNAALGAVPNSIWVYGALVVSILLVSTMEGPLVFA